MYLIRHFKLEDLLATSSVKNIVAYQNYLIKKPDAEYGEIILPPIHPRWLYQYFGFEILSERSILVAPFVASQYKIFDDGQWEDSAYSVFYTPLQFREKLPYWTGALQLHLQLSEEARLKEVLIGYEVKGDLTEYLLQFALPKFLSIPVTLAVNTYVDGTEVRPPKLFALSKLKNVRLQPFEKTAIAVNVTPNRLSIDPGLSKQPARLYFDVVPKVDYARATTLYQIGEVPSVILRPMEIERYRIPMMSETIMQDTSSYNLQSLMFAYDQPIDVTVVAPEEFLSREIAIALIKHIKNQGRFYAPSVDLYFDVVVREVLKIVPQNYLKANLPSINFQLIIKNLSVIDTQNMPRMAPLNPEPEFKEMTQKAYEVIDAIAAVKMPRYTVVTYNEDEKLIPASASDRSHAFKILGILEREVNTNELAAVITEGIVIDPEWNWMLGVPLFVGERGRMVQVPTGTAFLQQIANPVRETKIVVEPQEIVFL